MVPSLFLVDAPTLSLIKTGRAGVIPFTKINRQLYFLFGVDTRTKELTDFGGGVKCQETSLSGAIREFREETNDIFSSKDFEVIDTSKAVVSTKMAVIFMEVNNTWFYTASRKFKNNVNLTNNLSTQQETSDVMWIHENKFRNLVLYNNDRTFFLWRKIQSFFKNDIDNVLKNLKI